MQNGSEDGTKAQINVEKTLGYSGRRGGHQE